MNWMTTAKRRSCNRTAKSSHKPWPMKASTTSPSICTANMPAACRPECRSLTTSRQDEKRPFSDVQMLQVRNVRPREKRAVTLPNPTHVELKETSEVLIGKIDKFANNDQELVDVQPDGNTVSIDNVFYFNDEIECHEDGKTKFENEREFGPRRVVSLRPKRSLPNEHDLVDNLSRHSSTKLQELSEATNTFTNYKTDWQLFNTFVSSSRIPIPNSSEQATVPSNLNSGENQTFSEVGMSKLTNSDYIDEEIFRDLIND